MKIYIASLAVFAVGVSGLRLEVRSPVVLAKSRVNFGTNFKTFLVELRFENRFRQVWSIFSIWLS